MCEEHLSKWPDGSPPGTLPGLLVLLLFGQSLSSGCMPAEPVKKEILQYYPTGEIQRRHVEVNGRKQGEMIEYFRDGKVQMIRRFTDDLQNGQTTVYYPSAAVREVQYYAEGKLHGGDTLFYEDGRPEFVRSFDMGLLHGDVRKFGRDGRVIFSAIYRLDTLTEANGKPVIRERPDLHR